MQEQDMQETTEKEEPILGEESNKSVEENSEKSKKKKVMGYVFEILIYLTLFAICAFVLPRFVVQRARVSGTSMENTLHDGDNVLVNKIGYVIGEPKRFDVVVFYPFKEDDSQYVKRVIGLPGETIQIKGPDIYINGEKLEENYGKDPITFQGIASEPLELGNDEYFLMGDNRKDSYDSRYDEIGPIHKSAIEGKAVLRIWPLDKFGKFQ